MRTTREIEKGRTESRNNFGQNQNNAIHTVDRKKQC